MNWEHCKNFGVTQVNPSSNTVKLYYDRYNCINIQSPNLYMIVESVIWQGDSLIVKGKDQYGDQQVYIYTGIYNYQRIF
jgi:hypothetical protein